MREAIKLCSNQTLVNIRNVLDSKKQGVWNVVLERRKA